MSGNFITLRSTLLLLLLVYLWLIPISQSNDIVASVFFSVIACIALICFGLGFYQYRGFRKNLSASINVASQYELGNSSSRLEVSRPLTVTINLDNASNLPCFGLYAQIVWAHEQVSSTVHYCNSRNSSYTVQEVISFPHRGVWKATALKIDFTDIWGLSSFKFQCPIVNNNPEVKIYPPETDDNHIPQLAAQFNEGDLIPDQDIRSGDPIDIKRYHPSDGVKKIIWKIYARTEKLVARQPEASIIPEGTVVLYSALGLLDDRLCSSVFSYLDTCTSQNQHIAVGCQGMQAGEVAYSLEAAENLLLRYTWATINSGESLVNDIACFLNEIKEEKQLTPQQLLLVLSSSILSQPKVLDQYLGLINNLEELSIKPILIMEMLEETEVSRNRITDYLIKTETENAYEPPSFLPDFLSFCAERQIDIVLT